MGTFGRLFLPGLTLFTGELPWRNNLANLSCIPAALYRCVFTSSPRFRRGMYLLTGTGARAGVRFHSANLMGICPPYVAQLNGCIALGEKLGWMDKQKALLISAPAIRRFESAMEQKPFELEIRNVRT